MSSWPFSGKRGCRKLCAPLAERKTRRGIKTGLTGTGYIEGLVKADHRRRSVSRVYLDRDRDNWDRDQDDRNIKK